MSEKKNYHGCEEFIFKLMLGIVAITICVVLYFLLVSATVEVTYSQDVVTDKYFDSGSWYFKTNSTTLRVSEEAFHESSIGDRIIVANRHYTLPMGAEVAKAAGNEHPITYYGRI